MENIQHIQKVEKIIKRIFNSIENVNPQEVNVKYIGKKVFNDIEIDQRCFQFQKSNSEFLHFELLIPSCDLTPHNIDLKVFTNQIIYKYNVENIACFINSAYEIDEDHLKGISKNFIFEIDCALDDNIVHKVYVDLEPDSFFK